MKIRRIIMSVSNNKALEQARISSGMAHYDRAIARANYFPNISASGTYMYNTLNVPLIDSDKSAALRNAGSTIQGGIDSKIKNFRAQLRGVSDVKYFLFRLQNIYA